MTIRLLRNPVIQILPCMSSASLTILEELRWYSPGEYSLKLYPSNDTTP